MPTIAAAVPLDPTRPREFVRLRSEDRAARARIDAGQLVRLTRGIAVPKRLWDSLDPDERSWLSTEAVMSTLARPGVVSHDSAAAYWRLPTVRRDRRVHLIDPLLTKTRTGSTVVRHASAVGPQDQEFVGGIAITSLRRTALDLVRSGTFADAVLVFDHLLHHRRATRSQLRSVLTDDEPVRGSARALRALGFADERCESPGESLSRVEFEERGVPTPVLQQAFDTDIGVARVDFWWPDYGVVGEFDGRVKYVDGSAGVEALWQEKRREDALRRVPGVVGVARWGYADLQVDGEVERLLRTAGLAFLSPSYR